MNRPKTTALEANGRIQLFTESEAAKLLKLGSWKIPAASKDGNSSSLGVAENLKDDSGSGFKGTAQGSTEGTDNTEGDSI